MLVMGDHPPKDGFHSFFKHIENRQAEKILRYLKVMYPFYLHDIPV